MSSVSDSELKEKSTTELTEELEAMRSLNSNLRTYLEHLRGFKKNLIAMNDNCKQLAKVNQQWTHVLSARK